MPASIADLAKRERSFVLVMHPDRAAEPVEVGEEPDGIPNVRVTYDMAKYTGAAEEELEKAAERDLQGRSAAVFLAHVLARWDLVDDAQGTFTGEAGAPVGVELETLMRLPITFLSDVVDGIRVDARPDESEGKASPGSFD